MIRSRTLALGLGVSLLAWVGSAQATLLVGGPFDAASCTSGIIPVVLDCEGSTVDFDWFADARASYGSLGARAEMVSSNSNSGSVATVPAFAEWRDTITIAGATLPNGSSQNALLRFDTTGSFLHEPPGQFMGTLVERLSMQLHVFGIEVQPFSGATPPGEIVFPLDNVQIGDAIDIRVRLNAEVQCIGCDFGTSFHGIADSLNTATLAGVEVVGFTADQFTVTGEVGGYANIQSVPEPGVALLVGLGLFGCASKRRAGSTGSPLGLRRHSG